MPGWCVCPLWTKVVQTGRDCLSVAPGHLWPVAASPGQVCGLVPQTLPTSPPLHLPIVCQPRTSFCAGPAKQMDLLRRVQARMELRPVQLCFKRLVGKTHVKVFQK